MSNYSQGQVTNIFKKRSKFMLNSHHKTSSNVGDLVPFYLQEVVPGDSFKVDTEQVNRVASAWVKSPMDNLELEMRYFFTPYRLIWEHWEELMGDNKKSAWAQKEVFTVPQMRVTTAEGVHFGSLADYFGIPINEKNVGSVSALPFRAYAKIYDDWFRDQNNQDPIHIPTGDEDASYDRSEFAPDHIFGMPAKINKKFDYFTGCLPAPQKGDPVGFALAETADIKSKVADVSLRYKFNNYQHEELGDANAVFKAGDLYSEAGGAGGGTTNTAAYIKFDSTDLSNNLYADLSDAQSITVNDLRFAFQLQRLLEKDARGGTRYTEIILNHFGVQSSDARLQRSEYLGGSSTPININQVLQTSNSIDGSPQANVSGYSLSGGKSGFMKGFTEHGMVIGVMAVRQKHTYQQGIERFWLRKNRIDFYDPTFANIGEQPVYQKEIFAGADADKIFGYNEAWADMRYKPDRVSGMMRSAAKTSFDVWHFADDYENAPVIGDEFVKETPMFVDRALAVTSKTSHQFIFDIYIQNEAIRVMPTYSVPGYIDQN